MRFAIVFTLVLVALNVFAAEGDYVLVCTSANSISLRCTAATQTQYDAGQAMIAVPMSAQVLYMFEHRPDGQKVSCSATTFVKQNGTHNELLIYGIGSCKAL